MMKHVFLLTQLYKTAIGGVWATVIAIVVWAEMLYIRDRNEHSGGKGVKIMITWTGVYLGVQRRGKGDSPCDGPPIPHGPADRLFWYKHDGHLDGSNRWTINEPTQVGTGWDYWKSVFGGADGVIYAIGCALDGGILRQDNWRWCHKCGGLFFGGNPAGACPAGGVHDQTGSGNYTLD